MTKLLLFFIFTSNLAFSQTDSVDYLGRISYLDLESPSNQEIRITKINYLSVTHILQIYYADSAKWHYRLAARSKNGFAIYEEDTVSKDIGRILKDLTLLKEIPSQKDIRLRHKDGTQLSEESIQKFFEMVLDGSAYKVEFWDNGTHGEIMYENPDVFIEILERNQYSTIEHEQFFQFVSHYETLYGPLMGYDKLIEALKHPK